MNYVSLQRTLHNCASLDQLKRIHALCVTLGFLHTQNLQQPLSCKLLQSYKNVGKTEQAQRVFDQIKVPDIVSWTCLLNLYLHSGLPSKSLSAFSHCLQMGLRPDSFLVVAALSSCGHCKNLVNGRVVHGMVLRNCLDGNLVVGNALIDMYCRNGVMGMAKLVFEKMGFKDVFSWTSLLNGYILCDNVSCAREVFDAMPERNLVSWTAMITGCVKGRAPVQALEMFKQMEAENGGARLCADLIVGVLSACADVIRDPSFIGSPVVFSTKAKLDHIPTLTDLTIDFKVKTICNQATVWRLSKEGSGFWFSSTSGNREDITSKFKIERLEGDHAYEIYSFKFCPSVPGALCAPVGTFVDSDGTKVLAVGDNIEPYYVRFQKVSNFGQEKNQAFSIV